MLLDTTTRKLQLVLTAAMTTANMPVSVYYVDTTATALPVSGTTPTNSNGVTAVDILAAPAASTQRKVNSLTVNNADTATKTVQIYLDDNGTDYLLCAATLQVGDVLGYTDTRGWYVNDAAGNLKVTPTNAISASLVTNTPAGNIAATTVQAAINELDSEKMAIATYDTDGDGLVDRAETLVLLCRNTTGVTISKMAAVYITGASGQNPTIALAKADSEATSSKTIGIVTADIANNATGYVAMRGTLHDYNTSSFADGTTLWLSAATAGALTTTRPTAPNHAVLIGFTAYSHANNGKIALYITNGLELDELHDVLITTVANNELLQYDSATATWKNRSTLAGLTFTAPILGTPASGDLRNCSLAVAPAIGGTTPAAGAFTTLSATAVNINSVYAICTATGTTGWSGYNVTKNGGGGLLLGLDDGVTFGEADNTGILRFNSTLHVKYLTYEVATFSTTGLAVTGIISGTSIQNTPIGSTTASTGAFTTLSASGNASIGGTSAWNSGKVVDVGLSASFYGDGINLYWNAGIAANAYNLVGTYKYKASGYAASRYELSESGTHYWYTAPSGTAGNTITFTERMNLSTTGLAVTGAISATSLNLDKTITAAGTTGAQTINKATGTVNFAAAAASLVVTNSLVTANSVINCTIGTNDSTMKSVQAIAAAGSFTIYPNAVPTAETRVNFRITN